MKKIKKMAAMYLAVAMALLVFLPITSNAQSVSAQAAVNNSISKIVANQHDTGTSQWEWIVFCANRSGVNPTGLNAWNQVEYTDGLDVTSLSDYGQYAKAIIILTSMGYDCSNYNGVNLYAKMLEDKDAILTPTYTANTVYTLIALDIKKYDIPSSFGITRDDIINTIVSTAVVANGMFSTSWGYDIDTTYMALQALAPYNNSSYPAVQAFITDKVARVSTMQSTTGFIYDDWGDNVDSTAMVALGLSENGYDITSYAKAGNSLLDALLSTENEITGYYQAYGSDNEYATNDVLKALVGYTLYQKGQRLYNMNVQTSQNSTAASRTFVAPKTSDGLYVYMILITSALGLGMLLLKREKSNF